MKKWFLIALVAGLAGGVGMGAVQASIQLGNGFYADDIRFDESVTKGQQMPKVPKSWQFVGVAPGSKRNVNNLYFRDKAGSMYIVQIVESEYGGNFWIEHGVGKLNIDPAK